MEKLFMVIVLLSTLISCREKKTNNFFWGNGEEYFKVDKIFEEGRFPNVVVAVDGTVITTWGNSRYEVRRSEDGGKTWEPKITVADPGFHGGGVIVDESNGDILTFVEESHPISPLTMYRSSDHGKTLGSRKYHHTQCAKLKFFN